MSLCSAQERFKRRDQSQPWRAWYKTSEWRKLREKVLKRDLYTCQQTDTLLIGKYPAPNSAVVDHIKPHRGDPALFWDETNLQAMSKEYHDRLKQSEERRGYLKGSSIDGRPADPAHPWNR